jgi:hypothetical protein
MTTSVGRKTICRTLGVSSTYSQPLYELEYANCKPELNN